MLRIVTFSTMGLLLEIVIFAAIALLLIGIFVYQLVQGIDMESLTREAAYYQR